MKNCTAQRIAFLAFLGALVVLTMGIESPAQEKKEKPPVEKPAIPGQEEKAPSPAREKGYRARMVVRLGYTRPGNPDDTLNAKGMIRPAALQPENEDRKVIGGTIYFMVLERVGNDGDTWATGMEGFDDHFVEGKNFKNEFSPTLDTQARYLYLYQVVNDRGLDPPSDKVVATAPPKALPTVPVAGTALRLIVDPRYITSWGHFKGAGFVTLAKDRTPKGDIRPAAPNNPSEIRLAVSSNPSVLAELPYKRYLSRAPAYPLSNLRNDFGVGSSTLNLKGSAAYNQLTKEKAVNPVVFAAYKENILQASLTAKEPEYVQLLYREGASFLTPSLTPSTPFQGNIIPPAGGTNSDELFQAVFRADWRGEGIMKVGFHSTLFGFTSDLPPTDEPIRIEDPDMVKRGNSLVTVRNNNRQDLTYVAAQELDEETQFVQAQAPGTGIVPAVGTAPTPVPAAAPAAGGPSGVLGGGPAGMGGGGFTGGGGAGGGAGGIGGFAPFIGGGGGGTGGGSGSGQGQTNQNQNQTPNPVNVNISNQQSQSQFQIQSQSQSQTQTGSGGAVPEPGAIILALLGLPGLFLLRRRLAASSASA